MFPEPKYVWPIPLSVIPVRDIGISNTNLVSVFSVPTSVNIFIFDINISYSDIHISNTDIYISNYDINILILFLPNSHIVTSNSDIHISNSDIHLSNSDIVISNKKIALFFRDYNCLKKKNYEEYSQFPYFYCNEKSSSIRSKWISRVLNKI